MISKHSHSVSIYTVDLKLLLDLQHSPEMITPRELFKMVTSCNLHIDSDIYKKWSPFLKVQSRCCTYLIYYIVSQDWMVWLNFEPAGSSLHFFWEKIKHTSTFTRSHGKPSVALMHQISAAKKMAEAATNLVVVSMKPNYEIKRIMLLLDID